MSNEIRRAARIIPAVRNNGGRGVVSFLPVRAGFDAASRSPESMRHFAGANFLSADAALSPDVRKTIISRVRNEVVNNGYAWGILDTLAEHCIGTGPRLQLFPGEDCDEKTADVLERSMERREKRFRQWCRDVGLCGKLKIARKSKARDGEVFLRKSINPKIRNSVKLDVTLFESEQVGSPLLSITPEYYDNGTPKEVDGILFDRYGNPGAYRFWTIHPGANGVANTLVGDSYLVNADQVIHYVNLERPGQHRGLSEFASTLNIFNDMRRYDAAVLAAAETAAEISFVLYTDNPADVDDNNNDGKSYPPGMVMELARNSGVTLPEGWKAAQMKAEQPTSTHTEFIRTMLRKAARAFSMPLNVAMGDSSDFNYASGRLDHQTYFRVIRGERALIEETILDDLLGDWERFDRVFYPEDYPADIEIDHSWMWDGFAHVDPLKEASAQNIRLNLSGTSTLAEECAMEGKDWGKVIRQRKRENDLKKRYGLPDTQNNQTGADAVPPEEEEKHEE